MRMGYGLSHYLYPLNWIPELPYRLVQIVFSCYTYVGGKERYVGEKPELSTSVHLIWDNGVKFGLRFPPLPQMWLPGHPGLEEGLYLLTPALPIVQLIYSCCYHCRLAQYAAMCFLLHLVFPIPYFSAKDMMEIPRVSHCLPALGALVKTEYVETGWRDTLL